ncbi:hypothetical protein KCMC57_65030 (plasmid) [Kitasatospora sp. CMC57]|uniref:Uncharacterized protein n=1 Tax=Kitasatospora sp. CMC57 TaxID=3231513 RepID=A0AB33K7I0_9ACTN
MTNRPETRPTTDPAAPEHQHLESPATPDGPAGPGGLRPTLRLLLAAGHSLAELNAAGRALQQRRRHAAAPDDATGGPDR